MTARRAHKPATPARPVAPAREVELKLRVLPQDLPALEQRLRRHGRAQRQRIDNIYYDTPDRRLAQARAALRLRCLAQGTRRRWVQTLKTEDEGSALAARGEWETAAPRGRLDLARLRATPLARLLGPRGHAALAPVFRTVFERRAWTLVHGGARIEAVIDAGRIQAEGLGEDILELELELLEGEPVALFDLALALAAPESAAGGALRLLPYGDSKAARGYRLAAGQAIPGPRPGLSTARAHGGPVAGGPAVALDAAARTWVGGALQSFLENAHGAVASEDVEFVHQGRVALRLVRVGLDLLAKGVDLPAADQRSVHRWARAFGAVRDWDVLGGELLPELAAASRKGTAHWAKAIARVERKRRAARARLQERLRDPALARLALRVLRWCAQAPSPDGAALGPAAGKELRARRRRLVKALRGFARASLERQHETRLMAKNLRYAELGLGAWLTPTLGRAQRQALARFQDVAGRARDLALARDTLSHHAGTRGLRRELDAAVRAQRRAGAAKARRLAALLQD